MTDPILQQLRDHADSLPPHDDRTPEQKQIAALQQEVEKQVHKRIAAEDREAVLQQQVDELTERDNWLTGLVNQYRKLYGTTGIKAAQEKDND